MRTIFRIARTELRQIFYSPVAWLVLAAFVIWVGLAYGGGVSKLAHREHLGSEMSNLTQHMFNSIYGLLSVIRTSLILLIPFLTMGLMSRERSGGTISLLKSSPVTSAQIVWGKYLAMVAYCSGFLLLIMAIMITNHFAINNQDDGYLASGAIGIFLLICLCTAIGFYMSCLTAYQIIAALTTILILQLLGMISGWFKDVDYLRNVTGFLGIDEHLYPMLYGRVSSDLVMYFVLLTAFFLTLAYWRLEQERHARPIVYRLFRGFALFMLMCALGVLSEQDGLMLYADLTRGQQHTLTANTRRILSQIHEPVRVDIFGNVLDEEYFRGTMPNQKRYYRRDFMGNYQHYLPPISFNYIYFYDSLDNEGIFTANPGKTLQEIAAKQAALAGFPTAELLSPSEFRRRYDLRAQENRSLIRLTAGNRSAYIHFYDDLQSPSELNIAAAFKQLTGVISHVAFLSGHGERDLKHAKDNENYKRLTKDINFKYSLVNLGFTVDTLNLSRDLLPANLDALVIADPVRPIPDKELKLIQDYLNRGGNLVVLSKAGNQANVQPIAAAVGLHILPGRLLQNNEDYSPAFVLGNITPKALAFDEGFITAQKRKSPFEMQDATAIEVNPNSGFQVDTLVTTARKNTWYRSDLNVIDTGKNFKPRPGDRAGIYPLALKLSRKVYNREQKIIWLANGDVFNNAALRRSDMRNLEICNYFLASGTFRWMSDGKYPVDVSNPAPIDNGLKIDQTQADMIKAVYSWIIPALLVLSGAIILIRRNGK